MVFVVGLTGGIGSGKSSVGRLFAAHGITVVDADAISRSMTVAGGGAIPSIRVTFGADFIDASGALNRARMRERVFQNAKAKTELEAILHPMIRAEISRQAAAATSPYVMLEIPLLIESKTYRARCQRILVIDVPEAVQEARVMSRDRLSLEQTRRIISAQATRAKRLAAADDVIDNSGSPEALVPQVDRLHNSYLRYAAQFAQFPQSPQSGGGPSALV
ncbi:MAG: dephospho-CoA kinase [Burkholderiales bacterium]